MNDYYLYSAFVYYIYKTQSTLQRRIKLQKKKKNKELLVKMYVIQKPKQIIQRKLF